MSTATIFRIAFHPTRVPTVPRILRTLNDIDASPTCPGRDRVAIDALLSLGQLKRRRCPRGRRLDDRQNVL